jgi:hypothetical protein
VPGYFFKFPKVKTALKGRRPQNVSDAKQNMQLNVVPLDDFQHLFCAVFGKM